MNKTIKFLTTLLLLAVSVGAWADTSTLTFTKACGGSGTADDGVVWTVTSDGTESSFDNTKGIHYGTSSAQVTYIKLSTSGISGTITKVVVNASTASGVTATASVTVGGNAFGGNAQSLSTTATDYTFEGSASGAIEVTVTKPSKATKALYVKSIAVTYSTGGGTTTVAAPTFSPAAGAVAYGTSVTLTQASAYMINYTTDGSEPTWDNGVDFATHPITITSDVTIKARAYDRDQNASAIVTAAYTVERPAAPTFSPAAGAVEAGTPVTISGTGRIIVYTTDGSTPSYGDHGEVYKDPITVNEAMTIKAIVVDSHDFESEVATASYTIYDPNAPGTQNNPYTVAQARAAIDAGTGKTGVYATGIVSAIPTAYSTQYSNITFNFVDEEGDTEFLQAYRCVGDKAANVQVGDIVVVSGDLTKYGSTYEFGQGCQLVSLTHPAAAVETPTFNPEAGTYAEAQNVTISCATNGATIYYSTDGTDPTTSSTQYTEAIAVSQTMTIKAIAVNGNDESSVAAATYHINSQDNPYTVAQALAFNEYPANNIYVHGIVSKAPTSLNNDGTLTYYISDNGEATNELEVYKGKNLENVVFDAVDDIQVGDIVTIYGNVKIYNGTKEFENGNYLVSFERPASTEPSISVANNNINVTAEGGEGTINVTYENISEVAAEIAFFEEDGTTAATYDWITAEINDNNNIEYLINANDGEARSAYMKVWAYDDDLQVVYSELITITQAAPVIDYATLPFVYDGNGTGELPQGFTVSGLGTYSSSPAMKFDGTGDYAILKINERPGKLTFDIKGNTFSGGTFKVQTSVDGTTFTDLESYTELGDTQSESFDNLAADVRYIKWIYTNKSSGNVALGNIQLAQYVEPSHDPTITLTPSDINVDAEEHDGTIAISLENLTVEDKSEFGIQYWNGGDPVESLDWITVEIAEQDPQVGEGYVVSYIVAANDGPTRNAAFKLYVESDEEPVYSDLVTITQAAYVAPFESATYTLANSITSGKHYIIASSKTDGDAQAMGAQASNNRSGVDVTVSNNSIMTTEGVAEFVICGPDAKGNYTIYDAAEGGYLYAASSSSNHLKTQETLNDNGRWRITFGEDGEANIVAQGTNTRNIMRYNSGSSLFSCYASGQGAVYLYEKADEATPTQAVSISSAGMATFCSENALDFTAVDAIHAYYVNVDNSGNLTFTRIRKIPANTGVLLRNAQGEDQGAVADINVPVLSGEAESVEGNAFVAVLEEIAHLASSADGFNNYILNKKDGRLGFYHANNQKVGAGKAYLRIDESIQARDFFGFNEGEATGIENVNHETTTNGRCYNLNGQQVSANYKGIVIVNGKKTIVK